jgi:MFS superfamily sulfate permease-like transporter
VATLLQIARHVIAVLVGYVLFAGASVALFALSHRDPHARQDGTFVAFSIGYGLLAAVLAGYVASVIGGGRRLNHARTLAVAVAAVAIVSMLARPGQGAVWSQLLSLVVFAPAVLLGGWLRVVQRTKGGER